jgi:hypothetical protein
MSWPAIFALLLAASTQVSDGKAIRAALKSSETAIDDQVQRMVSRTPFVLLGTTRGAYLAGYGAVFTLEVNLAPVAAVSPFRPGYTPQEIQNLNRQKRERLGVLKPGLRQLLIQQAVLLHQVPPAEKVAMVVSLFNFNWEDTTGLPSQIVMQISRQTALDLQARRAGAEAAERAVETREF